ncbi:MAG TPA: EamA family transporter [Gemmatimonadaceae bacterium]|nr:EamA family transporter [Gemmatimonadaceae bacterium]
MPDDRAAAPPRLLLVAAFAALYIIWGSTYLGMKIGVETMPPWPLVAARHSLAGIVLYSILRLRGVPAPKREHWKGGLVGGVMLLVIGNGMVALCADRLASGVSSLVVATTPIWIVATASTRPGGRAPVPKEWLGLTLGLAGLALLGGPSIAAAIRGDAGSLDIGAMGLVLLGCMSWSIGSVLGRDLPRPDNAFMGSALQMLTAGALLLVACTLTGQWSAVHLADVSSRSWIAFWYLIFFGSLLGFTAYVWLLRVAKTSHVATYAYVNPIVALLLGASIGHEAITPMMLIAGGVTLLGVVLVVMPSSAPSTR